MSDVRDLDSIESAAYAEAHSDGLMDLFFGLSVAFVGAAWLWLPDLAGLAGVIPAVLVGPVIALRTRIVEPRLGYVRWSEARVRRERRGYVQLLALGLIVFVLGVAAFVWTDNRGSGDLIGDLIPGLPSVLLAVGAFALGLAAGVTRALAYAAVLAAAGLATIMAAADPGLDMLVAGTAISLFATGLVTAFLRHHSPNRST